MCACSALSEGQFCRPSIPETPRCRESEAGQRGRAIFFGCKLEAQRSIPGEREQRYCIRRLKYIARWILARVCVACVNPVLFCRRDAPYLAISLHPRWRYLSPIATDTLGAYTYQLTLVAAPASFRSSAGRISRRAAGSSDYQRAKTRKLSGRNQAAALPARSSAYLPDGLTSITTKPIFARSLGASCSSSCSFNAAGVFGGRPPRGGTTFM